MQKGYDATRRCDAATRREAAEAHMMALGVHREQAEDVRRDVQQPLDLRLEQVDDITVAAVQPAELDGRHLHDALVGREAHRLAAVGAVDRLEIRAALAPHVPGWQRAAHLPERERREDAAQHSLEDVSLLRTADLGLAADQRHNHHAWMVAWHIVPRKASRLRRTQPKAGNRRSDWLDLVPHPRAVVFSSREDAGQHRVVGALPVNHLDDWHADRNGIAAGRGRDCERRRDVCHGRRLAWA
eukprot:1568530-Prymnesium_polylepis.2